MPGDGESPTADGGRYGAGGAYWDAIGKEQATEPSMRGRPREMVRIELPAEPNDEMPEIRDWECFWDLLSGWARHHRVDPDLALLICACATAHAAGPRALFEASSIRDDPAPTLIALSNDMGFHQAVQAAIAPFLQIQGDLEERYGHLRRKPDPPLEFAIFTYRIGSEYSWNRGSPAQDLNPDLQPCGVVKFVFEGRLPKMVCRALKRCHLHAAMSVGEIEKLPESPRARENRVEALTWMLSGYSYNQFGLRGFIRFSEEDLFWLMTKRTGFQCHTLSVSSTEVDVPRVREGDVKAKEGFDVLHKKTARKVTLLRFDRAECGIEFKDRQAAECHQQLRESYRKESSAESHKAPMCEIVHDVIVWYLLHLASASRLPTDAMGIPEHAIAAARRLRRRIAENYDRQDAIVLGRGKRKRAQKLLHRLECLGQPSTPRDLARGLDKQRMDEINPLIKLLVDHGVFTCEGGRLMTSWNSQDAFARIGIEHFMPALRDVPYSATLRLDWFEQRERDRIKSSEISPTINSVTTTTSKININTHTTTSK